ncbi:MAG: DHA2 family efflux MFS transporter permease subunit [Acidimicrobiales bacterium]
METQPTRIETGADDRRWLALAVLCLSLVLIVLDNTVLNVALPTLVRELGASTTELQWMVDAYVIVFAGLLLTAGALGDRFGRRRSLQLGLAIFALASGLAAFSGSSGRLIASRAVMGFGAAFVMPATLSIITNIFTDAKERARAIGVWAGMAGVGVALGPVVGGWLLGHFWWGSAFLINIPLVAVALVAGRILLPESRDPAAARLDVVGAGLSIAAMGALLWTIIEAPQQGWTDTTTLGGFALAGVLLFTFLAWERRVDEPMLDVAFFRDPRFSAASASIALVFFALFGSFFLITQLLQFVMGYTALQAGVRMLPVSLVLGVVAPLSARLAERLGTKVVVAGGLVIVAIGLAMTSTFAIGSSYPELLASMLVLAAGMGLTMAPATESIMGSLPPAKAGVGSAVNDTTRELGGALGVAVLGSLLASGYASSLGDALRGFPVPPDVVGIVQGSVGAALQVAGGVGGAAGQALALAARTAFVDAMGLGLEVAAGVALVGAVISAAFLPSRVAEAVEPVDGADGGDGDEPASPEVPDTAKPQADVPAEATAEAPSGPPAEVPAEATAEVPSGAPAEVPSGAPAEPQA